MQCTYMTFDAKLGRYRQCRGRCQRDAVACATHFKFVCGYVVHPQSTKYDPFVLSSLVRRERERTDRFDAGVAKRIQAEARRVQENAPWSCPICDWRDVNQRWHEAHPISDRMYNYIRFLMRDRVLTREQRARLEEGLATENMVWAFRAIHKLKEHTPANYRQEAF